MNEEILKIINTVSEYCNKEQNRPIRLYDGICLMYFDLNSDSFSISHSSMEHILQITYCRSGQMLMRLSHENLVYLNPGDFSLNTMDLCADSVIQFPSGSCSGLTIFIDMKKVRTCPPEMLTDCNLFSDIYAKFCNTGSAVFISRNEQSESIFSEFYGQPENIILPYQKIKTIELLLYLSKLEFTANIQIDAFKTEQIEIIRKIHDHLTSQIHKRITIEELSRIYLMNPTTLKNAFKSVYGNSIATHIKEHRMEYAAKLLRESEKSIAEIAQAVGYDSQSRFSAAFKGYFNILPREYRKNIQ